MKHYGKLTAAAAAGFMALSAMGVAPVFAATDTANVTVTVTKTENVKDPVGTISFNADPRTPGASETPLYGADTIAAGPSGGLSVADVTFTPADTDTQTTTKTAAITINKSLFKNLPVGQYCYTISQKSSDIDGLPKVDTSYNAHVFKTNDGLYLTVDNGNGTKLSDENISFAQTYTTKTLTVKKVITGNQANKNDTFPFTVTVTPSTAGEKYVVSEGATAAYADNGTATVTATLGDNQTMTISGLSAADAAAIQETFASTKGYNVTSTGGDVTKTEANGTTTATIASAAMGNDNKTVTVTNDKTGEIPTGILMTAAPYAGLVALGGIFAGLFFRHKRED
ncbi:QVPTGV class sortase B protein-sorting domain-containing protein [Faecalibaculum rodentium]|uniref:QVPTGV class sortase B protein-sorting domain-containing protein n=1 Tax=Faecalibaculum rodentium TaxID=1702221 RepID=UPI00272A839C|nr:QVPTGV class sortase B protein-sorting domain-containing protein [Faecalibaculum rodentium]